MYTKENCSVYKSLDAYNYVLNGNVQDCTIALAVNVATSIISLCKMTLTHISESKTKISMFFKFTDLYIYELTY